MTPEGVKLLVAAQAGIDPERVMVCDSPDSSGSLIRVDALTEREQRAIQNTLRTALLEGFRVERCEVESKPRHYTLNVLMKLVRGLGEASDTEIDGTFALRCAHLPEASTLDEVLDFLRDLRDECVYCAGASNFVMRLLGYMLEEYPESEAAKTTRRAKLEARYDLDDD